MNLKGRHLTDPNDFTVEELYEVVNLGNDIAENREKYGKICDGKILGTCFL